MNAPFGEKSAKTGFSLSESDTQFEAAVPSRQPYEDPFFDRLRTEATQAYASESALAAVYAAVIHAASFEEALLCRLASRLGHPSFPADALARLFSEAMRVDPTIGEAAREDISAVVERDPASDRLLEPFLFFKGYAAIQTHRLAHWFWKEGQQDMALYLQSRSSEVFQTDIHPAAQIGKAIFLDHATGFVAGETVIIEDNVSILHGVTLGGSGTKQVRRHPHIKTGVLIGAGANVIGPIEVGAYSKIASGSLVTQDVPPHSTVVGVPARIIKGVCTDIPAETMDQVAAQDYDSFTYVI